MEINEKLVLIKGKGCIPNELKMSEDVVITIKGSVVNVEDSDNFNGTIDRLYKIKILTVESCETERTEK